MSANECEKLTREEAVDLLASLSVDSYAGRKWVEPLERRFREIRGLGPGGISGLLSLALGESVSYPQWHRFRSLRDVTEHLSDIAKGLYDVEGNEDWGPLMTKDEASFVIREFGECGNVASRFGIVHAFVATRIGYKHNLHCDLHSQELVISCLKRSLGIVGDWGNVSIQRIQNQIYRIALGLQVQGGE